MKRWLITLLLVAAVLAAAATVVWRHILPVRQVSDIYRRYEHVDGIAASYIHNYPVNDTLALDVTLLEVSDSAVWEQVCEELSLLTTEYIMTQIPEEYRDMYFEPGGFESRIEQDTIVENGKPRRVQTVFIYYRFEKTVCIFNSVTDGQYNAIMNKEIDKI